MSLVLRALSVLAIALLATLASVGPASAHASQIGSTPAADAILDAAPMQVDVEFDSPLLGIGAAMVVRDSSGSSVTTGAPEVSRTHLRIAVDPGAPPAVYTVAYRVVSKDGHTIESSFTYTVAGPTQSAGPPPTTPSASGTAPPQTGTAEPFATSGNPPYLLIAAGLLALILLAAGAIALRR